MKSALLLIDIQNQSEDTNHNQLLSDSYIHNVLDLINKCESLKYPIIHITTEYTQENMPLLNKQKKYTYNLKGSKTAQEIQEIAATFKENHYRITKSHYDSFYQTELDELLNTLKIDTLIIAGLYAHWCVSSTIFSALSRNYKISVIPEAIASRYPILFEELIKNVWDKQVDALRISRIEEIS